MPIPPRMTNPPLDLRQEQLDHRPERIVHLARLPPSHPTPPEQGSQSHPTNPKITSLGVVRNTASFALHRRAGFRVLGTCERTAATTGHGATSSSTAAVPA